MSRTFTVHFGDDLGTAVRQARPAAGLTQGQLADQTGIARTYLARMEIGLSALSLDRAMRALRRLGADITVTIAERRNAT